MFAARTWSVTSVRSSVPKAMRIRPRLALVVAV